MRWFSAGLVAVALLPACFASSASQSSRNGEEQEFSTFNPSERQLSKLNEENDAVVLRVVKPRAVRLLFRFGPVCDENTPKRVLARFSQDRIRLVVDVTQTSQDCDDIRTVKGARVRLSERIDGREILVRVVGAT